MNLSTTIVHRRSLADSFERKDNFSDAPQDGDNMADLYDYYDLSVNESDPADTYVASSLDVRSVRTDSSSSADPVKAGTPTETKEEHSWAFFPTLPTVKTKDNTDQRIVGGDEAIPGQIPWQVLSSVWC